MFGCANLKISKKPFLPISFLLLFFPFSKKPDHPAGWSGHGKNETDRFLAGMVRRVMGSWHGSVQFLLLSLCPGVGTPSHKP